MKLKKGRILGLLTCSLITLAATTPSYAGIVADNGTYNTYSYGSNSYSLSNNSNLTNKVSNKTSYTSTKSQNEVVDTPQETTSPDKNTSTTYSISPTNSYSYGGNSYSLSGARSSGNTYSLSEATYKSPSTNTAESTTAVPTSNTDEQGTPGDTLPSYEMSKEAEILLDLINKERTKEGLNPLKVDTKLFQIAQFKSQDMYDHSYFSHTSPTFGKTSSLIRQEGISYYRSGENIGRTYSVYRAHNGFMNSSGHRANIMNPDFTHIGIGIVGNLYTEVFIQKR